MSQEITSRFLLSWGAHARLTLAAILLAASGCGDKIPVVSEATSYFHEHQTSFKRIVEALDKAGLDAAAVQRSVKGVRGQQQGGHELAIVSSNEAILLKELMLEAGIVRISRSDFEDGLVLVPTFSTYGTNPRFIIEYLFLNGEPASRDCSDATFDKSGRCMVTLDSGWWLSYSWVY